ncbi:MAG: hypothetical protein HQ581_11990 [Planctomycetes bacterium]|nr:hypothetical protein [Planctomycetota bacterium]
MPTLTKRALAPASTLLLAILLATTASAQYGRRPPSHSRQYDPSMPAEERDAAIGALDELIEQAKTDGTIPEDKIDAALSVLSKAAGALPPEELLPKLNALMQHRTDAKVPAPRKPLRREDRLDSAILFAQMRALRSVSPEQVTAHPCAESFPGPVGADAARVSRTIQLVTDKPGWQNEGIYGNPGSRYWHSTGLYAAPGELITVTVPETVVDKELSIRIGCHADRLWRHDSWRRPPEICTGASITAVKTLAANAFGGLIYIETPRDLTMAPAEVTIEGAVLAPHYVYGKTDLAAWRKTIRNHPAPWAELQTDKLILTIPSTVVRDLEDPKSLMAFWDKIMDCYADLLGRPAERRRTERFVADVQISAGYMHSGYPLMTGLDIAGTMVDAERIRRNGHHGVWGLFHEIGHNHQRADWTFSGTTEVTVNLFSLYVMEKICGLPLGGHGSITPAARSRNIKRHVAGGMPFDRWKSDPFLALTMYMQLIEEFGWEPFTKVFTEYRELPADERARSDDQRRDQWMVRMSRTVGKNLGPFFEAWGVPTSESARKSIAELPAWMPEEMAEKSE